MSYDFIAAVRTTDIPASLAAQGCKVLYTPVDGTEDLAVNVGSRGLAGVLRVLGLESDDTGSGQAELEDFRARLEAAPRPADPLVQAYVAYLWTLVEFAWTTGPRDTWVTWG